MSGRRLIITLTNPIPPGAELSKVLSIIYYSILGFQGASRPSSI